MISAHTWHRQRGRAGNDRFGEGCSVSCMTEVGRPETVALRRPPTGGLRHRHSPTRADLASRPNNGGNVWREVNNAIGAGTHDHDSIRQYFYVLLKLQIAVERYKYFAYAMCTAQ
jgi:hypothetical protein